MACKILKFHLLWRKKNIFERENIKRIKNKEGKNGRDVNHKEKPKESLLFLSSLWIHIHRVNLSNWSFTKSKVVPLLYAGDFFRSPCGQNKSAGIFTPNCMAFLFICHYSKVVGLLILLKGWKA